jgi:hypothetical protein
MRSLFTRRRRVRWVTSHSQRSRPRASLLTEAAAGAQVGALAGALLGVALGAGLAAIGAGAALGALSGFVVGLMLWLEVADLPEAPIPEAIRENATTPAHVPAFAQHFEPPP